MQGLRKDYTMQNMHIADKVFSILLRCTDCDIYTSPRDEAKTNNRLFENWLLKHKEFEKSNLIFCEN